MAAKLKLISKPIPWSLLVKALLIGATWLLAPRWIFFLVALYLYANPLFHFARLLWPFTITLFAGFLMPKVIAFGDVRIPNVLGFFFLFFIFYLILGIKELIFVNRKAVYGLLVLLLFFLIALNFFSRVDAGIGLGATWGALLVAFAFFLLLIKLLAYEEIGADAMQKVAHTGLIAFLVWQVAVAILFLPLLFSSQGAILFLFGALILTFFLDYHKGALLPRRLMTHLVIFLLFVSLVLWRGAV